MKKKLTMLLLALCMTASMMATAYAAEPLEYTIDGLSQIGRAHV